MGFKRRLLLGVICFLIIGTTTADDDYAEYDDTAASPKPVVPSRHSSLLKRRNPLALTKGKPTSTTTTTTAAPQDEDYEETEEKAAEEEEAAPAEATPTQEPVKKLKGGFLRPFRSNDDLLATLKRRREQAASQKGQVKVATEATEVGNPEVSVAPAQKPRPSNNKRRFNSIKSESGVTENSANLPKAPRRFSAKSST